MMGQPSAEVAEAMALQEGECSSYGTAESDEEGEQEFAQNLPTETWMDDMQCIKQCMANMEATQTYIVEKLALLEKAVMAAQEDMVWVRADQAVVHEVVENLVEHVSTLNPTVVEVEGQAMVDPEPVSAWGSWKQPEQAKDGVLADSVGARGDVHAKPMDDAGRRSNEMHTFDSEIQETQAMDTNTGTDLNITSLADEDAVGVWYANRANSPSAGSPRGTQPRRQDAHDPVEDGCEQMELTLDGPEVGTVAPGRFLWESFQTTMKDMQATMHGGGDEVGGCTRSKRGREGTLEFRVPKPVGPRVETMADHADLNLNLSPEKLASHDAVRGRGTSVAPNGRGTASRGRGRGSGRGTGRVKRPPTVEPRYRSTVSVRTMSHLFVRCSLSPSYRMG